MSYILNGTDLATFDWTPGQQPGSNLALSGFLDMPSRIGKTFHSWGDRQGVQPYVSASEIRFGGRDLQLIGYIRGENRQDCLGKAGALKELVDGFTGLTPLVSTWGTYNVRVTSMPITSLHPTTLQVLINMREPVVDISGTIPTPDNGEYGIDDISFEQLGFEIMSFSGDRLSRPGVKTEQYSSWINEGYQITPTNAPVLDFALFMKGENYTEVEGKIRGLYALFSKPGTRMLHVENDTYREVFITEGFQVSDIRSGSLFTARVSFKAIQVSDEWYFLTDNANDYITTNTNDKILIYGK